MVTALTAQNTQGVRAIHYPPPAIVAAQIEAVLEDFAVAAIKIGMLGSGGDCRRGGGGACFPLPAAGSVGARGRAIGWLLLRPLTGPPRHLLRARRESGSTPQGSAAFIVYDPVMIASSGEALSGAGFVEAVRLRALAARRLPDPEPRGGRGAARRTVAGSEADMARQGAALLKLGPRAALMKGGHLEGDEAVDLLVTAEGVRRYAAPRIASRNLHGTGCTLSSAIAANVVLGMALPEAVAAAKAFVGEAIERGRRVKLGDGRRPPDPGEAALETLIRHPAPSLR